MEVLNLLPGTRVRHYKGGVYVIVTLARHTETEEMMVVYRSEDGSKTWVRPLEMFGETVEAEGRTVPRFCQI